ncbi:MAG: indolepyruvate ferredoxin oxidoreductase subunit alpha [Synergistales bacterium]|nr:indolepyruvate ferredoxin oxidoreductase subunit alpha [Synergistales bacterium]
MNERQILLGNEAIARGIVEAGCEVATAYPGTPSSEILPAVAAFADALATDTAVEWCTNEKVAFEVAAAAGFSGKRSAAVMKQVGLNVASDALMSVAHFDIAGGFLLVVADDPGPHSSQTGQDSRSFAMFAKIPCFDPSTAAEAKEMVFDAYELSERHHLVTMLRPTGRVDHCRQDVELGEVIATERPAQFKKDIKRWVCLPANVRTSHPRLNEKNRAIREEFEQRYDKYNYELPAEGEAKLGIIAGGVSFAVVKDLLDSWGRTDIAVLKIGTPVPLPLGKVEDFISRHDNVLVLEETYPVIENQLHNREAVKGRWNGAVPSAGELLPEIIEGIILDALGESPQSPEDDLLGKAVEELGIRPNPPMMCPGCPHRASFLAIREALPKGIFPSDIGCYTLGVNQKTVDSVICMGASATQPSGFYLAHKVDSNERPIVATIGDSTFFHMGLPGLVNAVYNRHSFVLAILDNSITAMTGGQPNPAVGSKLRKGDEGRSVDIAGVCRGCGVEYVKTVDPYNVPSAKEFVKDAWDHAREHREPAVLIFKHPCMLLRCEQERIPVAVDPEKCIGCRYCIDFFNCPGLRFDEQNNKAYIDERFCVQCGVCIAACPQNAIVKQEEGAE